MLVLTRKSGEAIRIGDDVKVVVVEVKDNQVKLGIEAPMDRTIHREEIYLKIREENIRAAAISPDELAGAIDRMVKRKK